MDRRISTLSPSILGRKFGVGRPFIEEKILKCKMSRSVHICSRVTYLWSMRGFLGRGIQDFIENSWNYFYYVRILLEVFNMEAFQRYKGMFMKCG